MTTLRDILQELDTESLGNVLIEDNAGEEWLPRDLLATLESNDEGKFQLGRAATRVKRVDTDIDSVIAYVSPNGYEYPHEPRWYVIRSAASHDQ